MRFSLLYRAHGHWIYGGLRVADAEAKVELTLTGDRQLFDRFVTWFPLPEKIG